MPGKHQQFQDPEVGCCGKYFLFGFNIVFWFSVFLGLIFFLELAAGILAFVFKDWIRDQLNLFINNNVKAYRDDLDLQNLIDFAQEYWSCCGARGPNDWNLNIYFNCTDLNPSRERCGVPFSCCVRDPAIFGLCLAQNLVSDIKAVKANWITLGDGYKRLNKQHFEKQWWFMFTVFEGSVGSVASTELSSEEDPGLNPTKAS